MILNFLEVRLVGNYPQSDEKFLRCYINSAPNKAQLQSKVILPPVAHHHHNAS